MFNAVLVSEKFNLDRILFVPAKVPVHKDMDSDIPASDRLRMVELAVEGNPLYQVLDIEINREEPSYTVITLEELKRMFPSDQFFLVIGTDSYLNFSQWKEYRNILDMAALVVMKRTDAPVWAAWQDECGTHARVHFLNNPVIDISSTEVRERIRSGRPFQSLVPEPVYRYITSRGLYQP